MHFDHLTRHIDFPATVQVIVEQPRHSASRMEYDPVAGTFNDTGHGFLLHARGFTGVYGWVAGSGVPPKPHWDILVLTRQVLAPGESLECRVCGVFLRSDDDHKFVAVDMALAKDMTHLDFSGLSVAQ